jgi:hypothetical protein
VIHHHGTPITPEAMLYELRGKHFCVSFSDPRQVKICHTIGQSVMLDNGAYSAWMSGKTVDWNAYAEWARRWLEYPNTWAVVPDVIDGSPMDNLELYCWFARNHADVWRRSAPVWHMHEPLSQLLTFCRDEHPRVCIGSSGEYADPSTARWRDRMDVVMETLELNHLEHIKLHMLRAMRQAIEGRWPFASADSTNVARNHHRHPSPAVLADRIDAVQAPPRWIRPARQLDLLDLDEVDS